MQVLRGLLESLHRHINIFQQKVHFSYLLIVSLVYSSKQLFDFMTILQNDLLLARSKLPLPRRERVGLPATLSLARRAGVRVKKGHSNSQ
jgi:hypothetical protein